MRRWIVPLALIALWMPGCGPSVADLRSKATTEFQIGHINEAKPIFQEVLNRSPSDPYALYYLGRIAFIQGQYESAIYYFQSCLDADPSIQQARFHLDKAQQAAGSAGKGLRFIP